MSVRRLLSVPAALLLLGSAFGCSSGAAELTADAPSSTPAGPSQPSESPTPSPSGSPTESQPPQEPPVAPPPPDGACRVLTRAATVQQRSSDRCRDQAAAYLGYPTSWSWGYTWPNRQQWDDGDRHTTCWAVTPR